jgi:mono/diheme cytochrome c family protein
MMCWNVLAGQGVSLARFLAKLCGVVVVTASAAQAAEFPPDQIAAGSKLFARNCSPCHGPRMIEPQGAFDLRTFPPEEPERFARSVTEGKGQMPAWGGMLKPDEIQALWSYVIAGEKK